MDRRKLTYYLLLNVFVSACVTSAILYWYDRNYRSVTLPHAPAAPAPASTPPRQPPLGMPPTPFPCPSLTRGRRSRRPAPPDPERRWCWPATAPPAREAG